MDEYEYRTQGTNVLEAMTSKIILMMSKNQELSKFQRIRLQESSLKESRFKNNQNQDSRLKIQDSREEIEKQQSRLHKGSIFSKNPNIAQFCFTKEFSQNFLSY